MLVGIFHPKTSLTLNENVMDAIILGFLEHEDNVYVSRNGEYKPCDLAVRWGMPSNKAKARTAYRKLIDLQHKGPIAITELGWLGDRRHHFQFGFNGLSGKATYYLPSPQVQEKRFKELRLPVLPQRRQKASDYILVCGQVPWDTSVQHIQYSNWLIRTLKYLKENTSLPIVFRPHPKAAHAYNFTLIRQMGVQVKGGTGVKGESLVKSMSRQKSALAILSRF